MMKEKSLGPSLSLSYGLAEVNLEVCGSIHTVLYETILARLQLCMRLVLLTLTNVNESPLKPFQNPSCATFCLPKQRIE